MVQLPLEFLQLLWIPRFLPDLEIDSGLPLHFRLDQQRLEVSYQLVEHSRK